MNFLETKKATEVQINHEQEYIKLEKASGSQGPTLRASKTLELSDTQESKLQSTGSKFISVQFDTAENERFSNRSDCGAVESEFTKKQLELSKSLKNQAKEIVFLREESVKAKQELDNCRNFIEFLIIHTGFQIDQDDAERLKLRLELSGDQADINTSQASAEKRTKNAEE